MTTTRVDEGDGAVDVARVEQVIGRFDDANARMLDGDCGLWKQLLSHRGHAARRLRGACTGLG